jgi:proteasome-associated ATPase
LSLLDECLAAFDDKDPRQKLLYKLRHRLLQDGARLQQREAEFKKLNEVVAKLTAPANRIGTLLELPADDVARVVVGGSEYYTNVDPRVLKADLKIGTQVLVNEAFAVIKTLGYDRHGPVLRIAEALPDGRLRFEQEAGRQALILHRSSDLVGIELKAGDEVRIDPGHRIAIEKLEDRKARAHLLDEIPTVTWEQIGGQQAAISAIRKAIEYPLLHAATFERYKFTQPKGFLLHGPPGCGKTLIGQATAASLSKLVRESGATEPASDGTPVPITGGVFLHVKGPEILNMWLGESERMVRDLFAQARTRRQAGLLPFIFIDEAESILGTRRAMRSFNISNTLVPMFCTEMDGIESLKDVVIILASNRPDLIDPAVLRPGRIDRKIKVSRPNREAAADILKVYLTPELPYDRGLLSAHQDDPVAGRDTLIAQVVDAIFRRSEETRLLAVRLRSGQTRTLYRGDLVSGAILSSIIQRAKERAIDRTIGTQPARERSTMGTPSRQAVPATEAGGTDAAGAAGLTIDDLLDSVNAEYREGEMLPPDDAAEEWLKLLDHHPEQVVGVSSFRKGRLSEERLVGQII